MASGICQNFNIHVARVFTYMWNIFKKLKYTEIEIQVVVSKLWAEAEGMGSFPKGYKITHT